MCFKVKVTWKGLADGCRSAVLREGSRCARWVPECAVLVGSEF